MKNRKSYFYKVVYKMMHQGGKFCRRPGQSEFVILETFIGGLKNKSTICHDAENIGTYT